MIFQSPQDAIYTIRDIPDVFIPTQGAGNTEAEERERERERETTSPDF